MTSAGATTLPTARPTEYPVSFRPVHNPEPGLPRTPLAVRDVLTLRQQFGEITARIRRLQRAGWLTRSTNPTLQSQLQHTFTLSQLVSRELQRPDAELSGGLANLLTETERRLTEVEDQLRLCEWAERIADSLQRFDAELRSAPQTAYSHLLQSAGDLRSRLIAGSSSPALVPVSAQLLTDILAESGWSHPQMLAQAALTTRWLGQISPSAEPLEDEQRLLLMVAGMLQDIGCWHHREQDVHEHSSGSRTSSPSRPDPNHPGIGAAIVAWLPNVPVMLPLLIGGHHERMDGTGYPQRIGHRRLPRATRWLGLVVRMAECVLSTVNTTTTPAEGDGRFSMLVAAGLRVWRDVRRGAFDQPTAHALLEALHPDLAATVAHRAEEDRQQMFDTQHSVPAPRGWKRSPGLTSPADSPRTTGQHPPVALPKFLRRRSGQPHTVSEVRSTASSVLSASDRGGLS